MPSGQTSLADRLRESVSGSRGFTLIETFIAVLVLMVALIGPMTLARQGLQSASLTANEVTAFYLAQGAMEYVQSVRDANINNGRNWLADLSQCRGSGCAIDTTRNLAVSSAIKPCNPSNQSCRLSFDPSDSSFQYSSGSPSQFYRVTVLEPINSSIEMRMTTRVWWYEGTQRHEMIAMQSLFSMN